MYYCQPSVEDLPAIVEKAIAAVYGSQSGECAFGHAQNGIDQGSSLSENHSENERRCSLPQQQI